MMSFRNLFLVLSFLVVGSAQAGTDFQRIARGAEADIQLIQKFQQLDRGLEKKLGKVFALPDDSSCIDSCIANCNSGGGSNSCWQLCSKQGWSDPSAVCAQRCGVATNSGSEACWGVCGKQGWSDASSVCAGRCGVSLEGGSVGCWQICGKQGWSDASSVCASRCGISTPRGSEACWEVCGKQGWSDPTSVCAQRCGTH